MINNFKLRPKTYRDDTPEAADTAPTPANCETESQPPTTRGIY